MYIGFGSIVIDDPSAMTRLIFEAIKKAGVRALVSKGWGGLGAAEGMAYVATVVCLSPTYGRLDDLASSLSTLLEGTGLEARAGVTMLSRGGVAVRLLARSAPELQRAIDLAWTCCRNVLWSLGPLALRKM